MTGDDYKELAEAMTQLRWIHATFISFIPEGSKERKALEARLSNYSRLRDLCENEATLKRPSSAS